MIRATLIYMTIFIGVAFMFSPRGKMFDPFILVDHQVHVEDFMYYLWQHGILILLMHVVQEEATSMPQFYRFMFWFQVADAVDYLMTNNAVWLTVKGHTLVQRTEDGDHALLTMNLVGSVLGVLFLILEFKED